MTKKEERVEILAHLVLFCHEPRLGKSRDQCAIDDDDQLSLEGEQETTVQ